MTYRELELKGLTVEAALPPKKKKFLFVFVLLFCLLGNKFLLSVFRISTRDGEEGRILLLRALRI